MIRYSTLVHQTIVRKQVHGAAISRIPHLLAPHSPLFCPTHSLNHHPLSFLSTTAAPSPTPKIRSPFAFRPRYQPTKEQLTAHAAAKEEKLKEQQAKLAAKSTKSTKRKTTSATSSPSPFDVREPLPTRTRQSPRRNPNAPSREQPEEEEQSETSEEHVQDEAAEQGKQQRSDAKKKKKKGQAPVELDETDAAHPSTAFFQSHSKSKSATSNESTKDSTDPTSTKPSFTYEEVNNVFDPAAFANATTFRELKVASQVHTKLFSQLNISTPTPIQKHAIPFLMHAPFFQQRLKGAQLNPSTPLKFESPQDKIGFERRKRAARSATPRDMIIQDMTGSGKTLAYALPLLSLIDNFSRHTQGVVIAPTRELAVQIFRILRKLNARSGGKNTKRSKYPVTMELVMGTVTEEYAHNVRANRPHIIVATPAAFQALVLPPAPQTPLKKKTSIRQPEGFQAISLAHVRMMVFDEIDHLLLPFTSRGIERLLQFYTGSRTHGSVRRMGRIVMASAAISERVYNIAKKWLNRPVTATSDGLLDGWVNEQFRLRDKFYLPRDQPTGTNTENDASLDPSDAELDDEQLLAARLPASASDPNSIQPTRSRVKVNLAEIDEELRDVYEEADEIVNEEDDEDAILDEQADEYEKKMGESDVDDYEDIDLDEADEDQNESTESQINLNSESVEQDSTSPSILRAGEFRLPGTNSNTPIPAVSLAVSNVTPSDSTSIDSSDPGVIEPEAPLPQANDLALRFLPPTLNHVVVHVPPAIKLTYFKSHSDELSEHEQKRAILNKVKILSQLHAILKPRVALVFFSNSREAWEIGRALRKEKGLRAEYLVSNVHSTVKQKIHALRQVENGRHPFLFATDLASRGLDIPGLTHVINFEPPKTALDYIHRAGRVERLGGKIGCTVVTIVKDERVPIIQKPKKEMKATATSESNSPPPSPPKNPSTFIGPQVRAMQTFVAQLHLPARNVIVKGGEFVEFVPPKPIRKSTSETAKSPTTSDASATSDQ